MTARASVSSTPEPWRPRPYPRIRVIDHAHAHQPLRARGHRRGDAGKADLGFLHGRTGVVRDPPAPLGVPGCRDRRHLHDFDSARAEGVTVIAPPWQRTQV